MSTVEAPTWIRLAAPSSAIRAGNNARNSGRRDRDWYQPPGGLDLGLAVGLTGPGRDGRTAPLDGIPGLAAQLSGLSPGAGLDVGLGCELLHRLSELLAGVLDPSCSRVCSISCLSWSSAGASGPAPWLLVVIGVPFP